MPTIALIDDREDLRETLAIWIKRGLKDFPSWEVLSEGPMDDKALYPGWLVENEIAVLVLDERLHETVDVGYQGSELAEFIREINPTLPIVIVTSHIGDSDLRERARAVDAVVSRTTFHEDNLTHVTRFVRAGTKYLEQNQAELAQLTALVRRLAEGEETPELAEQIDAVQQKLSLSIGGLVSPRSHWLNRYEELVSALENEIARLEQEKDL